MKLTLLLYVIIFVGIILRPILRNFKWVSNFCQTSFLGAGFIVQARRYHYASLLDTHLSIVYENTFQTLLQ